MNKHEKINRMIAIENRLEILRKANNDFSEKFKAPNAAIVNSINELEKELKMMLSK